MFVVVFYRRRPVLLFVFLIKVHEPRRERKKVGCSKLPGEWLAVGHTQASISSLCPNAFLGPLGTRECAAAVPETQSQLISCCYRCGDMDTGARKHVWAKLYSVSSLALSICHCFLSSFSSLWGSCIMKNIKIFVFREKCIVPCTCSLQCIFNLLSFKS